MILVSACLLGLNTRYDGGNNAHKLLLKYNYLNKYIPICPEELGGLPTPRLPAEICGGTGREVLAGTAQVFDKQGRDVTKEFLQGTEKVADILAKNHIIAAILKERSPSCGVHQIYDGTFKGYKKAGQGVTGAFLGELGIPLYSEAEIIVELLERLLVG